MSIGSSDELEEQKRLVEAEIDGLVGMEMAKDWFRKFKAKADYVEKTGTSSEKRPNLRTRLDNDPPYVYGRFEGSVAPSVHYHMLDVLFSFLQGVRSV